MNAAFLLVTTAWIAGADTAAPAAPPPHAAAPVYSVGTGGCGTGCAGCGGCASCGCDTCCESEGFLSKLKGRFHRSDCGCGCESEGFLSKLKGHMHHGDCGCDTGCGSSCDTCGGHGGGLREKLHGLFHRGGDCGCCDSGCGSGGGCSGGGYGGVVSPVPGGGMQKVEPIGPPKETPKKLPTGDEKKGGSVQLIPQPIGTPVLQVAPTSGKSPF